MNDTILKYLKWRKKRILKQFNRSWNKLVTINDKLLKPFIRKCSVCNKDIHKDIIHCIHYGSCEIYI